KLSAWLVDANLAQYLTGLQISRQQIDEEVFGFDCSFAVWPNANELAVQRKDRRRPITSRIGVRQTAADSPLVAHLDVADTARAVRQQRTDVLQQLRRFQLVVRGRGADQNLISFFANVGERWDARDVDEQLRLGQA